MQATFHGVEFLRILFRFKKGKENSSSYLTSSIKRKIRRFHVVVVQWTSKKCTKKRDERAGFRTDFTSWGRFPGRDPFNQNSNRSDREKRTTSIGGPVFSKLFWLDRTDPLSFGPKFPESLVELIAPPSVKAVLAGF